MIEMDWQIRAQHENGNYLNGEEVRELISLSPILENAGYFDPDQKVIGDFSTQEINAFGEIKNAVVKFCAKHPDVGMLVFYKYDTAWNPDGFLVHGEEVRELTGKVIYTFDDNGALLVF